MKKDIIIDFLNNANYIVFLCELFENENFKTIGNEQVINYFQKLFSKNH